MVVLTFAEGIWLWVGLGIVTFFAGMLPELFIDFRYGKYRKEWELANREDPE
ncbi:MAG: YccS/YhfK family membrane protein [Actinomycetota bacterium]|nr:YccS/YhfK family membrane protein [Actinomycetota bacterium]